MSTSANPSNVWLLQRVSPNTRFEIDDISSPWSYSKKFDYIFGRYLMNALKDYKRVIEQSFE